MKASYPQIWFTFGPQTRERETLRSLIEAGATGARLTFSYGTVDLQRERAELVREAANEAGREVFIVADLQGEKCRLAKIEGVDEIPLKRGQEIVLTREEIAIEGTTPRVPVQLSSFLTQLRPGMIIIEGDGALTLEVLGKSDAGVICSPQQDGVLHPGRGIIVQGPLFRPLSLTQKDRSDLAALAQTKVFDAVAVSFAADHHDIEIARDILSSHGANLPVIAKIETQAGVENIDSLVTASDAVMAARGDLALAMPWVELPKSVSVIAEVSRRHSKPWILATQIAEGLERFVFPTRAEICDLAHWVQTGAYGAMASYETAFGPRPKDTITAMARIFKHYAVQH